MTRAGETARALEALGAPLRTWRLTAAAGVGAGGALLLLGTAAWSARLGLVRGPSWVPLAWVAALGVVAWVLWLARRRLAEFGVRPLARRLEKLGAWRLGALRAMLEAPQAGSSLELAEVADRAVARDVATRGAVALTPVHDAVRRETRAAAGLLMGGIALLGAARPFAGPPALLWHPLRAWQATLAPVRLEASEVEVSRGAPVQLRVAAFGRREATLWLRAPGEAWRAIPVPLDSSGRGVHEIPALTHDVHAHATSGGRGSDTVMVEVRQPVFLAALALVARYPAYLALEDEPVPTTGDTVLVPAGTRLEASGSTTGPLAAARWDGPDGAALEVDGPRFGGAFLPRTSGTYRLVLAPVAGAELGGDPVTVPLRVVPDLPPALEVPVPGVDTNAAPDMIVPVVIDTRDDHGLRSVVLESRRIAATGERDPVERVSLPLPAEGTDRALLSAGLALGGRGLAPGDTLRFWAVATDNSPARQVARSREYVLRILTRSEARAEQRRASDALAGRLDSLAEASRALERRTEDLARAQTRDAAASGRMPQELGFEQARKAEAVAAEQQALLAEAEAAREALADLQRQAEAAGLADSAFQRRLQEVAEQLERALSPELRQQLQELQAALRQLDAPRTQEALKDLAQKQEALREALERAKSLFERAAMEGDLANLADESRELTEEQSRWNDRVGRSDSAAARAAEQQLARRADSLAAALEAMAKAPDAGTRAEALEQAASQARQASRQMRQAAESASKGRKAQAQQQGEEAEQQLAPLEQELDEQREQLASEWRDQVTQALDQALADASRLAERQLAVQQAFARGEQTAQARAEQAAVEEGVQRLAQQLREASGQNALVSPQLAGALGAAQRQMGRARDAVSGASPNAREAADRAGEALDALNSAAYGMLRARDDVNQSQSGTGLAEAMERMSQMAGQQGQLSQDAAGTLPMMGGTGGSPDRIAQLGARQRALAEQLERMRGQGNLPGAGEMASEAKDLAKRLEAGRLDRGTVERQERLFRRMLDAGRTLQGEQQDEQKERQSTAARGDSVRLPPALRARLDDATGRPRLPTWDELQQLSPAERRIVVDYFRRLSTEAAP